MNKSATGVKAAPIAFIDVAAQQRWIEGPIKKAIDAVLAHEVIAAITQPNA